MSGNRHLAPLVLSSPDDTFEGEFGWFFDSVRSAREFIACGCPYRSTSQYGRLELSPGTGFPFVHRPSGMGFRIFIPDSFDGGPVS